MYNGKAITFDIQSSVIELLKKSYIINGADLQKNADFIQKNLQNLYPGSWNVIIFDKWDPLID